MLFFFFFFFLFKLRGQQFPRGRDSIVNYSLGDKNIGQTSEDLVNRPLQKRERTGKEYGCFPFV